VVLTDAPFVHRAIRPEIKMQLKRIQQQSEAFDKTMLSSTVVSRGWTCVASDAAFILKNVRARNTLEPQFVPDILESMKSRARSVAKEAKLVKGSFVAFRKDLAQVSPPPKSLLYCPYSLYPNHRLKLRPPKYLRISESS
jgi:hypothetical protein